MKISKSIRYHIAVDEITDVRQFHAVHDAIKAFKIGYDIADVMSAFFDAAEIPDDVAGELIYFDGVARPENEYGGGFVFEFHAAVMSWAHVRRYSFGFLMDPRAYFRGCPKITLMGYDIRTYTA